MVYLREIIKKNRNLISQYNNIETVAYLYASDQYAEIKNIIFDLSPEESIALEGYLNKPDSYKKILSIISKYLFF